MESRREGRKEEGRKGGRERRGRGKEGRKEGRKEERRKEGGRERGRDGRKERRKEGTREGGRERKGKEDKLLKFTFSFSYSDGVGRTGVFCTLSIVLERMRSEGVVDIFQTVKLLRTQRPNVVQTQVGIFPFAIRSLVIFFLGPL